MRLAITLSMSKLVKIEGLSVECDPALSAVEDCDMVVSEGADPKAIAQGVGEPDEALINAMGRRWVVRVATQDTEAEDTEEAWEAYGSPWCEAYNAAYRARAAALVSEAEA